MKRAFLLIAIVLLLFLIGNFGSINNKERIIIQDKIFTTEFAETDKAKAIGLSKYDSIDEDFAMVFEFGSGESPTFWMKGMRFPIDIIFVNNSTIVQIYKNVQPPKSADEKLKLYKASSPADTVVEIKAGLSEKYNFEKGGSLKIER